MKIYPIGGFNEVGKNMVAVEDGKKTFILDCGLYLPPIVEFEEGHYTGTRLREIGALPYDSCISHLRSKVRAMLISHAHLDHVGATPFLEKHYKATIYGTPFTMEVLNAITKDNELKLHNKRKKILPNSSFVVDDTNIEFIHVTHSTLQCVMIVIHTKRGAIVYACDFKFDNSPILGKKTNYERLRRLGREGVYALIVESLYASLEQKTPSEKIAKEMLGDVMLNTADNSSCMIVTTYSSHIARLKSIVEFGKKLDRKIVFLGRSLHKYVNAAARANLIDFHKDVEIYTYRRDVRRILKKVSENRNKYLLVCTGHQGEPGSVLVRLASGELPFKFYPGDHVIFSSTVIPVPVNIANRKALDKRLKERNVRIFTDVHVSGHAAREDLRELIKMLQPEHILPAHGDMKKQASLAELCTEMEMDYKLGKNVHLCVNGRYVELD